MSLELTDTARLSDWLAGSTMLGSRILAKAPRFHVSAGDSNSHPPQHHVVILGFREGSQSEPSQFISVCLSTVTPSGWPAGPGAEPR